MCLESDQLTEITRKDIDSLRSDLKENPDCVDFDKSLARLEGHLELRFGMALALAHKTTDFQEVQTIWKDLKEFSDFVFDQVYSLVAEYSSCPHDLSVFEEIKSGVAARCRMLGI